MNRPLPFSFAVLAGAVACSGSGSGSPGDSGPPDTQTDGHPAPEDSGKGGHDASPGKDAAPDASKPKTTIAKARSGNVTTAITVDAFVTALAGVPKDYPGWYIEDPAGGPNSGVAVYCDPLGSTVCSVPEPALHDLIEITGSIVTYKGQLQLEPTAMTVIQHHAKFPPIATVTAKDIAPTANSPYRGVFVKLEISSPTELVVDSVTPAVLFDTNCGTVPSDAGVEGGAKDGGVEAGLPHCAALCAPPAYSGFRANDGAGNEVYIEAPFFYTDPLQSSPECLGQPGVVPVTVGMSFKSMQGILDVDPYGKVQDLSPVLPSDYSM
jgi:hypothetical protein